MRTVLLFGLVLAQQSLGAPEVAPQVAGAAAGVPVAARDLPRGRVLRADDIASSAAPAGAAAPPVGPGWVTRRVVAAGEPLRPPAVEPPQMVRAGEPVQVVWKRGRVELRLRGEAMNSASLGEPVRVRVDLRRRFEGVADGPGRVRLQAEG